MNNQGKQKKILKNCVYYDLIANMSHLPVKP